MTVAIINVYGIYEFAHISKEVVASLVISNLGKSIADGLLKLIPAAGTIIGGAINATVAVLLHRLWVMQHLQYAIMLAKIL